MEKIEFKKLDQSNITEIRQLFFACNDYFQLIDGVSVCGCRAETEFEHVVAEKQGKIYGVYIEEKLISVFFVLEQYPEATQLTISLLLVDPNYRNQSIGNKVVTYVEEGARKKGIASIIVGVDEINQQAIRFWKKFGFKETGKRKRYQHVMRTGDIMYLEKVLDC